MEKLVIGIDMGGTSIRAALAPAAGGGVLCTASAGAGNPRSVPAEVLTERLTACVAPLAEAAAGASPGAGGAGDPGARVIAVVAGVAGADPRNPDDAGTRRAHAALRTALRRAGAGEARVRLWGDTEIAFASGPGAPASGVVAVAGTGAAAARIADRRQTATTDGHGWLLGDEGSGFWIARAALRAALRALDGRGPATELADLLRQAAAGGAGERGRSTGAERLRKRDAAVAPGGTGTGENETAGGREGASAGSGAESPAAGGGAAGKTAGTGADGRTGTRVSAAGGRGWGAGAVPRGPGERAAVRSALVDAGFAGAPVAIARLCPVVVRAAEAGDAVAGAILDEAADRLAETVAALAPVPGEPLVTTGGLLAPAGPLLARFTARMRPYGLSPDPVPDGLAGAVALARTTV